MLLSTGGLCSAQTKVRVAFVDDDGNPVMDGKTPPAPVSIRVILRWSDDGFAAGEAAGVAGGEVTIPAGVTEPNFSIEWFYQGFHEVHGFSTRKGQALALHHLARPPKKASDEQLFRYAPILVTYHNRLKVEKDARTRKILQLILEEGKAGLAAVNNELVLRKSREKPAPLFAANPPWKNDFGLLLRE